MASPLKILQKRFVTSAYGAIDPAFVKDVAGGGRLSARQAVAVYRSGYPARLSEALGETFEACWRMLGDDDFLKSCRLYARRTPSTSYNLSDYGRTFPEFLHARFKRQAPFIGALGRLELAFKDIFHSEPHSSLSASALASAVDERSVLTFGSAVSLLAFKYRAHDLWKRDRSDDTSLTTSDWEGSQSVILYKNGGSAVFSKVLTAPEAAALRSLMKGRPLAEALTGAVSLSADGSRDLFTFVSQAGLIAGVR